MKKICLSLVLLLFTICTFAQKDAVLVGEHYLFEGKDTARSFVILGNDKDKFIAGARAVLGHPAEDQAGVMVWRSIAVENVGDVALIRVTDGILTHDNINSSATFVPFTDAADKQRKMTAMTENQSRQMRIQFCYPDGKCMIYSREKEMAAKAYLTDIIKKG